MTGPEDNLPYEDLRVLLLEDNPYDAELIQDELKKAEFVFTVLVVDTQKAYIKALDDFCPDIILSDYDLSSFTGAEALQIKKSRCPNIPFILVTGAVGEERAIEMLTGGATDYVLKKNLTRLIPAFWRALRESYEHRKRKQAEAERDELVIELEKRVLERTAELQVEISARKLVNAQLTSSENRLRESESRAWSQTAELQTILDTAPVIIWIARERDCWRVTGNRAAYEFLRVQERIDLSKTGPHPEALAHYRIFHDDAELQPQDMPIQVVARSGRELRNYAMDFHFDDGSIHSVLGNVVPVLDSQGQPTSVIATFMEITERKQFEDELERNQDLLIAMNKELDSFTYTVSHDLQAPLRAIDGFSRMILKDTGEAMDEETKRRFGVIRDNVERMQRLIEDLLGLSRIGRQGTSFKLIDMSSLVNDAWKEIEMINSGKPMVLKTKDILPAYADQNLVRQVLVNLLSNAIKYSATRKRIEVEVGSFRDNSGNVYYVKDKGVGFDMKYHDRLFGVFQRLPNASEFEGTGIGLSIAQRIVHLHGGQIWASGKLNKGAVFYFRLPGNEERERERERERESKKRATRAKMHRIEEF